MSRPAALTRAALRKFPLPPIEGGDKNEQGRILLIAGSRDTPGSASLAAHGAMRAGAGKIRIATVESRAAHIALAMPEARVSGLAEARDGGFALSGAKQIAEFAEEVDAIIAGPGMRENKAADALAALLPRLGIPLVLDAALLHALPARAKDARRADRPPILLPHHGEMASLLNCAESEVAADPLSCGRACADRYDAVTLVKGAQSHIVAPDGRAWLYRGGGPGLGVSGSGDTLAGIVGGLLARGADPLSACLWGVFLHGEAGAALAKKIGARGYLAREIPGEIPALLSEAL
jgi:ADP-dependent NAD(P)H-hydrate dehydratase